MPTERILLVDPRQDAFARAARLLLKEGREIVWADSPAAALVRQQESPFDVALIKAGLGDGGCFELLRRLKENASAPAAVVYADKDEFDTARRAVGEGACCWVLEPFDASELEAAIKSSSDRRKLEYENARLRDLAGLVQVSEAVGETVGRDELLNMILRMAMLRTGATRGSIMLKDDSGRYLRIVTAVGLDKDVVQNVKVKVGDGIAGIVAQRGEPVLVTNIDSHPEFAPFARHYQDKSFMSVPLECEEAIASVPMKICRKVIGVMNVHRRGDGRDFTARELQLLTMLAGQAAADIENARLRDDLENTYMNAFGSMALLLEAKDPYTQGHTERVGGLCEELGRTLKMDDQDLHALIIGARLHDLGKIGIHESILNKPGKLTDEEWLIVREHPVVADRVLAPIMFLQDARPVVRGHHERLDGRGYPDGLKGDQLSLGQRIIIVADAYDAMSSTRSYRAPLTPERIAEEMMKNVNSQFDGNVVEALFEIVGLENPVRT